jgi:molecular chaperone DnaK (HSP70)
MNLDNGVAEVLSNSGDDHRLVMYLDQMFDPKNKTDIKSDARAMSRLRIAAERAKRVF